MHNEDLYLSRLNEKSITSVAIARTLADKVILKENGIPDDAVARGKPSVIKKLEENMKLVDMEKMRKEKLIAER